MSTKRGAHAPEQVEQAIAIALVHGAEEAAARTKIPRRTISRWISTHEKPRPEVAEVVERVRHEGTAAAGEDIASLLASALPTLRAAMTRCQAVMDSAASKPMEQVRAAEALTKLAVDLDRLARLDAGKPTSIDAAWSPSDELRELLAEVRQRVDAGSAPGWWGVPLGVAGGDLERHVERVGMFLAMARRAARDLAEWPEHLPPFLAVELDAAGRQAIARSLALVESGPALAPDSGPH